jgi:4-amino-4-deoxy-L-arabinose transferase-like glycosyltransferase
MAPRRRLPLIPLLITLLAAALQFSALAAQSLWYDEGFSVWLATQSPQAIIEITAADIQPPLYYLLLNGWMHLTGQSEYTLRFLSALFAVLCVPLMGQVARRLTGQPFAGTVAALMIAVSPLWLWYGREVRNYALLLAVLLAGAYALLNLLKGNPSDKRTPLTIALLLTIGLYTHYFMLFVFAAWGLVAGIFAVLRPRERLRPVLLAFGLPALLYAPWVGIMVTRLGEDRSYWEGELNITEALLKTFASWMAGHTLAEGTAIQWGLAGVVGAVLGIGILVAESRKPKAETKKDDLDPIPHSLQSAVAPFSSLLSPFFIAAWLIIPIVSYLAIAFNRPKFNTRYLIFSAPAFWLALVVVVIWLWRKNKIVGGVVFTILLLSQLQATYNLYTDPTFAKADWRDVAAYIQDHRQPNERILLVSGHAYPMTDYYLPDVEIVPLPPERTLDTRAVLGVDTAQPLVSTMAGSEGVWLINWQDEVVDPEGVVPAWVTMAGGQAEAVPLFKEVRLSHWTFATDATFADTYSPQHPLNVRFEDALTLQGWSLLPTPNPTDEGLEVQLFWSAQRPLEGDYNMRLRVVDEQGFEYGVLDQRPTAYNLPTFRWQPNEPRLANLQVPLLAGTPPGEYWVDLSIYENRAEGNLDILDSANAPQGQTARIGPISLAPSPYHGSEGFHPRTTATINQPLLGDWEVTKFSPTSDSLFTALHSGQRIPLYLWLSADSSHPITEIGFVWQRGDEKLELERFPLMNYGWQAGDEFVVPFAVRTPTEAGTWELAVEAFDAAGNRASVMLDEYEVESSDYNFNPPTPDTLQAATFGEAIRLLGYSANEGAGNTLQLTLHWESLIPLDTGYTTFVHLLDANGVLIPNAGQDKVPLDGARPTDSWVEGEYLSDTFTLTIPTEGYATPYQIEIGWYDAQDPTLPRLTAIGDGADGNRVLLQYELP